MQEKMGLRADGGREVDVSAVGRHILEVDMSAEERHTLPAVCQGPDKIVPIVGNRTNCRMLSGT